MSGRLIDPREHVERIGLEHEGWLSQRSQEQHTKDNRHFDDGLRKQRIIVQEPFVGFRAGVAANATTAMHIDFRTGTTAVLTQGQSIDVPAQARVLVVRVISTADVTAGTITPQLSVTEDGTASTYLFEECELSATVPRVKAAYFKWENAVQIAKDGTFQLQLVADVAYLPTTNNYTVRMVLGYEDWVSS